MSKFSNTTHIVRPVLEGPTGRRLYVTDESFPGMGDRFVITRPVGDSNGASELWHERDLEVVR